MNALAAGITPGNDVPCVVSAGGITFRVESIAGAAAAVASMVTDYGLRTARWKPATGPSEAVYAFVALGFRVHAVWFDLDCHVGRHESTACGIEFDTVREPLLPRPTAASTVGSCHHCLAVWRARYDQAAHNSRPPSGAFRPPSTRKKRGLARTVTSDRFFADPALRPNTGQAYC